MSEYITGHNWHAHPNPTKSKHKINQYKFNQIYDLDN